MGVTLGHRETWPILDTEQGWYTLHTLAGWAPKPPSSLCIFHHGHTRMHNPDLIPGTDRPAGCFLVAFSGFSEFDSSAWYPQPGAAPRHLRLFFFLWPPRKAFLTLARVLRGALLYSACLALTPQPDCRLINLLLTRHRALGGDWQGPCHSHGCLHIVQCHHRAKSNSHQSVSSVERPKKVSQPFSKGKRQLTLAAGNSPIQGASRCCVFYHYSSPGAMLHRCANFSSQAQFTRSL